MGTSSCGHIISGLIPFPVAWCVRGSLSMAYRCMIQMLGLIPLRIRQSLTRHQPSVRSLLQARKFGGACFSLFWRFSSGDMLTLWSQEDLADPPSQLAACARSPLLFVVFLEEIVCYTRSLRTSTSCQAYGKKK